MEGLRCIAVVLLLSFLGGIEATRYVSYENFKDSSLQEPPLTITAFNVQVFGTSKASKPEVMDVVKKVVLRSDIALIQEIRDSSNAVAPQLLNMVNSDQHPYKMTVSTRLGRTNSKEQYGFYYRSDKVSVVDTYQYPDVRDRFERPPYAVRFSAPDTSVPDFAIIAIHTSPSDAVNETSDLAEVYDVVRHHWGLEDILIAGDLNADCNYVDGNDWSAVKLRSDKRFNWLTADTLDTTVSATDCTYDRFVAAGNALQAAYIPASSGLIRYDLDYDLNITKAKEVSDHYPIIMQLAGRANTALQKSVNPSIEFTVENVIPVINVNDIRAIYRTSPTKLNGFTVETLNKKTGGMAYVIASQTGVPVDQVIATLKNFQNEFPSIMTKPLLDSASALVWANVLEKPFVYGLDLQDTGSCTVTIHCRLQHPLTCKVVVRLQTR